MPMLALAAGDYRLVLEPARGGSIAEFRWRGEQLMRPTCGPCALDTACFPLVPFSNRIAYGRFAANGAAVCIAPNMPGTDHPHPLHGFGWLTAWDVLMQDASAAVLEHRYGDGGEWPWPYRARQRFTVGEDGLTMELSVQNRSASPMPAGLGFHPYFPRRADTVYCGRHRGEWRNSVDGLPQSLDQRAIARDWWDGAPVGSRQVDTVYCGRDGALSITWPDRALVLTLQPSENLAFTTVYTPADKDYFCIEPVSHGTDAINRGAAEHGLVWLAQEESLTATLSLSAAASVPCLPQSMGA
jgi:aldose 1-epimerase